MRSTVITLGFLLGLAVGCGNDGGTCSEGQEGCACTADGLCLEGLKCLSNVCVDPGTVSDDDVDADADADADADNGDGDSGGCTPGAIDCECVDGTCGLGLECVAGICQLPGGDGDTGTDTDGGACVEQHVGECFVDGQLLGECCEPGDLCISDGLDTTACEPLCKTHAECPHCCGPVVDQNDILVGKFCYPTSAGCNGTLCIDTCGPEYDGTWAFDGVCDDGGPDSTTSVCELGTDCGDCGVRPKEMADIVDGGVLDVVAHEFRASDNEVRILFNQAVDLDAADELIRIQAADAGEFEFDVRRGHAKAFKGVPTPVDNLVIVTWDAPIPAGGLRLTVGDYQASLAVPRAVGE